LDGIAYTSLTDGDAAIVAYKSGTTMSLYFYVYDSDDTTTASSPTIIAPDPSPSGGRWFLGSLYVVSTVGNSADGSHYLDMSNTATLDAGYRADGRCWYAKDNNRIECYDGTNVQYWTATGNE
jgi:hypothetical protein